MHRLDRRFFLAMVMFSTSAVLAGCDPDEPDEPMGCASNDECAAGELCGADGMCVPDIPIEMVEAPGDLQIALSDTFSNELVWQPSPTDDPDAGNAAEYQIYRAPLGTDAFEMIGAPVAGNAFEDASSEAGYRRYSYRVTAVIDGIESEPSNTVESDPFARENELLDATFAIDIQDIDVTFDMYGDTGVVEGRAILQFVMRPGQVRPRVHFRMATGEALPDDELLGVELDGEALSLADDLISIDVDGTNQNILEIQRDITDTDVHTLDFRYILFTPGVNADEYLYTRVSDLSGRSNSYHFPCLNTPGEVAIHHLTLRMHNAAPDDFVFFGSGAAAPPVPVGGGVLEWKMDTEVEIPSSGVLFGYLPSSPGFFDVSREQRVINGIDVDVIGIVDTTFPTGPEPIAATFSALETILPQFEADLGPLPMDSLTIVVPPEFSLWPGNGPMEFFGGTYTSLSALPHEIFHMYFAHGVVFKTYRDSWLDEAIDVWYTENVSTPIAADFSSDMVGFVLPTTNEFDPAAYNEGSEIIERFAMEAGGREAMIGFLRALLDEHRHKPMGTFDFIRHFSDFTGVDLYDEIIQWGYAGERSY